jgi:hypothetical protein
MVTPEEREEIINAAMEKTLLSIPDVIRGLIDNQITMIKNNKEFYSAHPEFVNHKDIVASVIEFTEGSNPFIKNKELLEKAVPEIKKRIAEVNRLGIAASSSKPDLGDL